MAADLARLQLIEEGRAEPSRRDAARRGTLVQASVGAAISIAISILFPLTWQWRSIIDCNIESTFSQ